MSFNLAIFVCSLCIRETFFYFANMLILLNHSRRRLHTNMRICVFRSLRFLFSLSLSVRAWAHRSCVRTFRTFRTSLCTHICGTLAYGLYVACILAKNSRILHIFRFNFCCTLPHFTSFFRCRRRFYSVTLYLVSILKPLTRDSTRRHAVKYICVPVCRRPLCMYSLQFDSNMHQHTAVAVNSQRFFFFVVVVVVVFNFRASFEHDQRVWRSNKRDTEAIYTTLRSM